MPITSRVRRIVTAVLALLATPALAVDYWVKNGGDDGASGTSVASAWATLPHAASQVGAGDTVHVLDGSYQGFYLTTSGTAAAPITFRAEGTAVQITADNPTTPDGINLEGASHVVIDGFVVNGRTRTGVRAVTASFVTVRNCKLGFNGHWGILTASWTISWPRATRPTTRSSSTASTCRTAAPGRWCAATSCTTITPTDCTSTAT